ncbi:MAG: helix-turn-helix domain-containing protein [Pseudomonadota bacterium]
MVIEPDSVGRKRVVLPCDEPCPVERGMRILGGKWTGSILWHLKDGPVRFNDLGRQLGGASKKMIAQRLDELEQRGMVERKVVAEKPIAVTYEATEFGRSAVRFLEDLAGWVEANGL